MDNAGPPEQQIPSLGRSGTGVVFIAASLTLLCAFLVPVQEKFLDVLWVFCFCLSAGVTVICMGAKTSGDLVGFVPMLWAVSLLRLVAEGATVRHIIQEQPVGALLEFTGSVLAASWPLGAALISLLISILIGVVIFSACRRITLTANNYRENVLILRQMGIETDLRLGVIDDDQAALLNRRVVYEARFFAGINETGLLMRAEAAMSIFLLSACLVFSSVNQSLHQSTETALISHAAAAIVGLSAFAMIPALVVAAACGTLMGKDTLTLRKDDIRRHQRVPAKKITVVDLSARTEQKAAAFLPEKEKSTGQGESKIIVSGRLPETADISSRNATEYYEKLSGVILTIATKPRVVLLASDEIHSLPVTVPVNIGIRLSQKNQKVLLVDADPERNAVGSVFDIDPETIQRKVVSSSLENLSVCSIPKEKLRRFLTQDKILERFETTLIYVPKIPEIQCVEEMRARNLGAFYFTDDENPDMRQRAAGKLGFCTWLCLIPSIQSVLEKKP